MGSMMESRVFVTARRMHELGLAHEAPATLTALEATPRPLTAVELLDGLEDGSLARDRRFLAANVPPPQDQAAAAADDTRTG